jgi:hypothetical protein
MPPYYPSNDDHRRIAALARQVTETVRSRIVSDAYLNDPAKALTARRRRLREFLDTTKDFQDLEELCAATLGTTAFGGEVQD